MNSSILIIEDEDELREIIKFNLEKENFNVYDSGNANDALIMLDELSPDLILLDLMLPGLKGEQFLNILKKNEKYKNILVIVISAKDKEDDIVKCLESGADDYLVKPFSIRVLITKVKKLLEKSFDIKEDIKEYKDIKIDESNYKIYVDGKPLELTHKEYSLLCFLVKHPKKVFTRNQLLSNVWGYSSDVYTRTVDSHISSLRKKLKDKGSYIKSIQKIGYKFE
ncbi:MAG: winged helix-turn-helix domain-containing protein [Deferribacterota bacterium]|nr:winged helix-turn-helix domain-containing protein [Deferribacterota bacterium]